MGAGGEGSQVEGDIGAVRWSQGDGDIIIRAMRGPTFCQCGGN